MIQEIELRGIERNRSAMVAADGALHTLVGWRSVDGTLRPAQGLEEIADVALEAGDKLLYVHRYGDYKHYIVQRKNLNVEFIKNGKSDTIEQEVRGLMEIVSLGNVLILSTADYGMSYYVWNGTNYVTSDVAELPQVSFRQKMWEYDEDEDGNRVVVPIVVASDKIDVVPDVSTLRFGSLVGESFPKVFYHKDMIRQMTDTYLSLLANMRSNAAANNVLVDSYFVRYGLRLYDGNYLYVSPPILLKGNEVEMISEAAHYSTATQDLCWKDFNGTSVSGKGYKLLIDFDYMDTSCFDNGMIVAIDVFCSMPILEYDADRAIDATTSVKHIGSLPSLALETYEITWGSSKTCRSEDIENYFNYYRIASYSKSDIEGIQDDTHTGIEIDLRSKIDNIAQLPLLKYNYGVHGYSCGKMMAYNGRLHIANVREELYEGFPLYNYIYNKVTEEGVSDGNRYQGSFIETTLYIDGEYYRVRSDIVDYKGVISSYISYPDARATKMRIVATVTIEDVTKYYMRELILKQHPFMDEAYYYEGGENDSLTIIGDNYEITEAKYKEIKSLSIYDTIQRPNVLKVSELNNPMLYPNDKTYSVGSGMIVSMAVATKAISQGQFGQYPLYVFTDEGIYAMMSGSSAEVVYSNMAPVSRHVVENARTVCSIDDAVVFGTRQGLFVMQGGESVNISTLLDEHGILNSYTADDSSRSLAQMVKEIIGVGLDAGTTTLRTMIADGSVAYSYKSGEVLLIPTEGGRCYGLSMNNQRWASYELGISYAVNSYPELLLVGDDNVVKRWVDEDSDVVCDELLLVTQPISMGDVMSYKKWSRIHLLSHLCAADNSAVNVIVAIAVSNDGTSWQQACKKELKMKELHNYVIPQVASGYRYMSLIIYAKGITKESCLYNLAVEYELQRVER